MRSVAIAVALVALACGAAPHEASTLGPWATSVDANNPLVGKTYDTRKHAFVAFERAEGALVSARFVLLGEKHDNSDHHRLQAKALGFISQASVVFEMIDVDLQPAVDAYLATGHATPDGLRSVLQWDTRGWPAWDLYRPIFEEAMSRRMPIVAGGLPHDVIKRLVHEGLAGLPPEVAAHAHLKELPQALASSLDEEIKASHCGALPDAMLPAMGLAQRVKDAFMADLMAARPVGAVLIAGNGHVRTDRGVPFALASQMPTSTKILTISFVEVGDSRDPATYASELPADFIVFTPRVDNADPCAKFR
jgi:uncharacterized iron-regulated protein